MIFKMRRNTYENFCSRCNGCNRTYFIANVNKRGAPNPKIQTGKNSWDRGASNNKVRIEYGWIPLHPSWSEGFKIL